MELLTARVSADSALAPDTPLAYVNDLDIDHDTGVIYFTDSQVGAEVSRWRGPRRGEKRIGGWNYEGGNDGWETDMRKGHGIGRA